MKTKFKCLLNQLYAVGLRIYKTFLDVTQKFSLSLAVSLLTIISLFQYFNQKQLWSHYTLEYNIYYDGNLSRGMQFNFSTKLMRFRK